ncbi:MAG: hypothetical protein LBT24_03335, partial [Tannerella sp.]|nr:hypothetical protein [Tannerella sp.]
MKKTLLLIVALCLTAVLQAQQTPLRGIITVQNSKVNTGKMQYVKNAQIEHPKAKSETSDDEGKFMLQINLPPHIQTQITIIPSGNYKDYV